MVLWLMGLAGSGKSTLSKGVYMSLKNNGVKNLVYLDGDEFREVIGAFGYDKASRIEVAKKRAMLCQMLSAQGLVVIASSISMFEENYSFNRMCIGDYFEVYVQCDFEELKRRNQKGLYSGKIANVVGVDILIDEPKPNLVINNTSLEDLQKNIALIMEKINGKF